MRVVLDTIKPKKYVWCFALGASLWSEISHGKKLFNISYKRDDVYGFGQIKPCFLFLVAIYFSRIYREALFFWGGGENWILSSTYMFGIALRKWCPFHITILHCILLHCFNFCVRLPLDSLQKLCESKYQCQEDSVTDHTALQCSVKAFVAQESLVFPPISDPSPSPYSVGTEGPVAGYEPLPALSTFGGPLAALLSKVRLTVIRVLSSAFYCFSAKKKESHFRRL